jgi:hypothetical protein
LTINGGHVSAGSLIGALPGFPVAFTVEPAGISVVAAPGAENGWKLLVLHGGGEPRTNVVVQWIRK